MAHNLSLIRGRVTMAYQGETPWHSLGTRMTPDMAASVDGAMTAAGLDWQAERHPLYLNSGTLANGLPVLGQRIPDRYAILRSADARYIGSVGPQFQSIQNGEAFAVLEPACRDHGVTIEAAGALGNGETVWMLAKLPTTIEPIAGDRINGYFLVVNGHDGTRAYGARPTPVRVICQNTLNAALSSGQDMIRIRHTGGAAKRVEEAATLVTRMIKAMAETGETFAAMAGKRMTPQELATYIETVLPVPEGEKISDTLKVRRDNIAALVFSGQGAELAGATATGSTLWGAYNAVTEYFDHVRPAEGKTAETRAKAAESAVFGTGAASKLKALTVARKMVAA